ncbi:hypothetical protein N7481_007620 [Penicillium waksmanii]|uniref:uncharacterized protein n=1 Tax=Penicillium waksmanii TaxID=69791 RepID=UPI0025473C93|nr:uncharacterized protein N7481_007620 [Penicillium waksmanii]KAJ5980322.1 hypothetical protein N7481_007620 [Penicillium waksmanii]
MDRTSDSEIPLESNDRSDKLPLYDDAINNLKSSSSPLKTSLSDDHQSNTNAYPPVYVNKTIAEDPQALYDLIREQARLPPRVLLHIRQNPCGGRFIPNFNFKIDLTSTLLRLNSNHSDWNELNVVRDGDGVEAYRGGWSTSLKWEHGFRVRGIRAEKDSENGYGESESQTLLGMNRNGSNEEDSSLMAWCERFCRDPAVGKTFMLQRKLEGFDQESLRAEVDWYLRSMNYEGGCLTTCHVLNTSLKVYSPHWYSHIRESIFVKSLRFCLFPLFTYLEGRYEVVRSTWWSSRMIKDTNAPFGLSKIYAHGRNEAKLVDFWSAAIAQAVRDRENSGRVLGLEYLESLQERAQERKAHFGPFLPERIASGSSTAGRTQTGGSNPP